MMTLILFGFFFLLVILNVPIGVSLGLAASIGLIYADFPLSVIPGIMYSGTGKFAAAGYSFLYYGRRYYGPRFYFQTFD